MYKLYGWIILLCTILFLDNCAYGQQQDIQLNLVAHLLAGKKIIKVKRDIFDPYVWALGVNNQVFRVNSETLAVDDYTPQFAAYSNFNFIDIAGSADSVYIATDVTNVIINQNGKFKLLGSADGLVGPVNSLGIQATFINSSGANILLIASTAGMREYDTNIGVIQPPSGFDFGSTNYSGRMLEANYRLFEHTEGNPMGPGPIQSQYIWFMAYNTGIDVYPVWIGGSQFGNNLNTVDVISPDLNEFLDLSEGTFFWGTENGMFQRSVQLENYGPGYINNQYLNGTQVNKISDIYGLETNLQGPYNTTPGNSIRQNLLVATDKGFYFSSDMYPVNGYTTPQFSLFYDPDIGTQPINDISVDHVVKSNPICEDGVWIAADDGLYFLKSDYSMLKNSIVNAIGFVNQAPTVTETQLCQGGQVTAQVNGYNGLIVQWYKDGNILPGENNPALAINAPGIYSATLNGQCGNFSFQSNQLTVDGINGPTFSFDYPDISNYCAGSSAVLTVQGPDTYQYRWYTNGVLNGITTSSLTINQSGTYMAEVSACLGIWVATKSVTVNFIQLPQPAIQADKPAYCIGDQAVLSLNIAADPGYTINWFLNGTIVNTYQNQTSITTSTPGSYTASLSSTAINNCLQPSNTVNLSFSAPPIVSIRQVVNTTLCSGQSVDLIVSHSSGAVQWSTGETSDQITVTSSGNYKATVTTTAGCTVDTSINVQFFNNPVLALHDTSLCQYTRQSITLTAPAGYSKYVWNNIAQGNTFQVNSAQTVTLTVTDVNGCQAKQQIIVADMCSDILIPNAFTPNGDGINDTWVISGTGNDPTFTLKVFNRYGSLLYQSKGYYTPWNGQYNGQKLPAGVYYYIITAKNGNQKFSGPLTIMY